MYEFQLYEYDCIIIYDQHSLSLSLITMYKIHVQKHLTLTVT